VNTGLRKPPALMGRDMTPENEASFRGLARHLAGTGGATPKTLAAYHQGCASLEAYLITSGAGTDLLSVTRDQVLGWIGELRERGGWRVRDGALAQSGRPLAKDSLNSYFCSARRFYNWAAAEDLLEANPFAGLKPPRASDKPVAVAPLDLVQGMIASCRPKGRKPTPWDRRDEFVIRLFAETGGPRCSEVAGLQLADLNMREDLVTVTGKGGKVRRFPMCPRTAEAAQRWLRARAALRYGALPFAVIGVRGQMSPEGIYDIVNRRSAMAGGHVHPHQIRHFAADQAKRAEMTTDDMMALFGWSTERMVARYGRELAEQRAVAASRRHALGNRL
jgi:site-specific recombinase XerD